MKYGLWDDVWFGFRSLLRNPSWTVSAVIMIAVGSGSAVSVFAFLDALLYRPLGVNDPSSFMRLTSHDSKGAPRLFSFPEFKVFETSQKSFSSAFAWSAPSLNIEWNDTSEKVAGFLVSSQAFDSIGLKPFIGRLWIDDDRPNGQAEAILTYNYWQRRFGRDFGVLGRQLRVNGRPFIVVGVMPEGFVGLQPGVPCEMILPLGQMPLLNPGLDWLSAPIPWLHVNALLRKDIPLAQVRAELLTLGPIVLSTRVDSATATADENQLVLAEGGRGESIYQERFGEWLYLLAAIAALLLISICVNLSTLIIARATARDSELSIRLALGASRTRLVRYLVIELLFLTIAGAALGLGSGIWASNLIATVWTTGPARLDLHLRLEGRLFLFVFLVCMVCTIGAGFAPTLRTWVRASATTIPGPHSRVIGSMSRLSTVLIVLQISLSMALLSSAGLFVRSLSNLQSQPIDIRPNGVVTFSLSPRTGQYPQIDLSAYYRELQQNVETLPGVTSVSLASSLPMTYWPVSPVNLGQVAPQDSGPMVMWACVAPNFFETLGTPILAGRGFSPADDAPKKQVAIVNELFAARYYQGDRAVGRRIGIGRNKSPVTEIVGVVRDRGFRGFRDSDSTAVYIPCAQRERQGHLNLLVKTVNQPTTLIPAIQGRIRAMGVEEATNPSTLDDLMISSLTRERTAAAIGIVFGLISTFLSAVGLYALLSYSIRCRTREIGVRMALGAAGQNIVQGILGHAMKLVVFGVCASVPLVLIAARYSRSLLFGLPPTDLTVHGAVAVLLTVVALLAAIVPAIRAVRIDPMTAMRSE